MKQQSTPDTARSSRLVPLVGALGIVAVAAGLVVALMGAFRPQTDLSLGVPTLVVIEPQSGDTVAAPLVLRFTAGHDLSLGGMGWASNDLHLHAYVDGTEIMPAAADVEDGGDGTFYWTIQAGPGRRQVQLRWADLFHADVEAGASRLLDVTVR